MSKVLFKAARLSSGELSDVRVADGIIVELGSALSASSAEKVVDVSGLQLIPGLIDLHTHLRQPGQESSETILSGSKAAAAGGFTTVHAMANTKPVADTAGLVEQVLTLGEQAGYVRVRPVGAVTRNLEGNRLADIGAMAKSKAQVRVFSDDGHCVSDSLVMRRALEYVKGFDGVIAQHAQDPKLTVGAQMNEGELSNQLGLAGWPAVAEESIIARDVLLAEHIGARLHVCHVSTAGSVEVIRWAKKRGIAVTAEVTPHHLLLDESRAVNYDSTFKVNPPLRKKEDVLALREALLDRTIDIVATDHAPHTHESKNCEWDQAAFGMIGLESALAVTLTALQGADNLLQILEQATSVLPAKIASLESPEIAVGNRADLTFFDLSKSEEFTKSEIKSKSENSPFLNLQLAGRVIHTMYQGYFTYFDRKVVSEEEISEAKDSLGS